jgi:ribosomal protein S18 acetylase RimI-like enzyme
MQRMSSSEGMNCKTITYREDVTDADIEHVRVIAQSIGFLTHEEIAVAIELVEERLNKGMRSGYYFLFAEHERKVVGYSCFGPISFAAVSYDIYYIAVYNDFRGLGIGKELIRRSESIITPRGGLRIYIETSSRPDYEATRFFYQQCGYHEEAILKNYYASGDHKIVYLKLLAQGV